MGNPHLTEPNFVTQLTKGVLPVTTPSIFKMNPRMMLILVPMDSLESPLNIDTISTNIPNVWLL